MMDNRRYSTMLLLSLGLASVVAGVLIFRWMPMPSNAKFDDLPMGSFSHPSGFIVSWDVDQHERTMLVRLRNNAPHAKTLNLDLNNLEATVLFTSDGMERKFSDHVYYVKMGTSEWMSPEIEVPAGDVINWCVPFDRFDAHPVKKDQIYLPEMTFSECVANAEPTVTSFWAFRYIPNQP